MLRPPKIIVDAGANIGLSAIYFANKYKDAKIIAIEPEDSNFSVLEKNAAPYENIIPLKAALWPQEGMVSLHDPKGSKCAYQTYRNCESVESNNIKCITIDSILMKYRIDYIDLLKIDIEGAESEVFNDQCDCISKVGVIIIELHERLKTGCNRAFFAAVKGHFDYEWIGGENFYLSRLGASQPLLPRLFKKNNPHFLPVEYLWETQGELGRTRQELGETQGELGRTRQELGETQRELSVVYNSNSWKIMHPVRDVISFIRKIPKKICKSRAIAFFLKLLHPQSHIEELICSRNNQEFDARLNIHQFVREFLRKRRQESNDAFVSQLSPKIWVYWAQGKKNMPAIVKACLNQLYLTNDEQDIVLLSDDNISDFVSLPDYVYKKIYFDKTHFSDILRVSLLAKYGGVWIDATCYCRGSVSPLLAEVQKSGFFAYSRNDQDLYMLSSWFWVSRPNEIIPVLLRDALYDYWSKKDELEHYFLLHFIFEALYNLDVRFRNSWDCSFRLNAYDPHVLQGKLFEKFDDVEWNRIMELSLIHKLTYKFTEPDNEAASQTYLSHILSAVLRP
jgi:FkbM family methyltransferase